MKGIEKEQFKTGERKDEKLEETLEKQKEGVKAYFEEKELSDFLIKEIEKLSDEKWEELVERRKKHHDAKPQN